MAHFRSTMLFSVGKIVNLTERVITVYSDNGDFVTLHPEVYNIYKLDSNTYYIVDEAVYKTLLAEHKEVHNLINPIRKSLGRDNIEVTILMLYAKPEVRIYPRGGR